MSLDRFCRKPVISAGPTDPIAQVATLMRENHVGTVVIVDGSRRPIGIVTDRDIACRLAAAGLDPVATPARAVMTGPAATVLQTGTIEQVSLLMRQRGVRRLPVVDREDRLVGLVALDDLTTLLVAELGLLVGAVRDNRGP